jgi:hypothetical protein
LRREFKDVGAVFSHIDQHPELVDNAGRFPRHQLLASPTIA